MWSQEMPHGTGGTVRGTVTMRTTGGTGTGTETTIATGTVETAAETGAGIVAEIGAETAVGTGAPPLNMSTGIVGHGKDRGSPTETTVTYVTVASLVTESVTKVVTGVTVTPEILTKGVQGRQCGLDVPGLPWTAGGQGPDLGQGRQYPESPVGPRKPMLCTRLLHSHHHLQTQSLSRST